MKLFHVKYAIDLRPGHFYIICDNIAMAGRMAKDAIEKRSKELNKAPSDYHTMELICDEDILLM